MTSNATSALFDVNLWLALGNSRHLHHAEITAVYPKLPQPCFCRVTQQSVLRLLSNPQVMGPGVHPPARAWQEYDKLCSGSGAVFLPEPDGLEVQWRRFASEGHGGSGSAWTDAYLAAFAVCAGVQLVIFDAGFKRYRGLDCRVL
jgi:toxin-antitoxin system PIN domain toxin